MTLSFMRVPEDGGTAYEPLQYPDGRAVFDNAGNPVRDCDSDNDGVFDGDCVERTVPMFERFGFFRTERRRYDDDALWTRDGRIFLANRFNIWERSQNAAGTTIPYENRQVRRVTYTANVDFPRDNVLYAMNDELMGEWDGAFRNTVAQLRTLGGINTTVDDVEPVLVWRENSCSVDSANSYASANNLTGRLAEYGITDVTPANVKRACSVLEFFSDGDFSWEKMGDLRHSFLHWVDSPQQAGPLGYGPTAADPVTGEIIAGYSNVYGASIETYAAFAADIAQLLDGSIDPDTFASGTEIREQIGNRRGFGDDFNGASGSFAGQYSAEKMAAKRAQFSQFKTDIRTQDPLMLRKFQRNVGDKIKDTIAVTQNQDLLDLVRNQGNTKLDRLAGSRVERELLVTDEIRRAMHGPQWEQAGDYQSPLKWMEVDENQREQRERIVGRASIMMEEWADEGVLWLAEELAGQSRAEIYARARAEIYRAVQAHEVGHTLGLRHNFEGSWDALNFHDEFWDDYNPATEQVERVRSDGTVTDADRYAYSSIMDYMPRPFDDWGGIGKYDEAAIAFGYGQLVEVWEPNTAAFYFDDLQFLSDYSTLPRYLGGDMYCDDESLNESNCHPDAITALTTGGDTGSLALNSYLFKAGNTGSLPSSGQDTVDRINRRRYIPFEQVYQSQASFIRGENQGFVDVFFDQVEVPYSFCPDERVFPSNEECQRWDKGANYREIIADRWERYDKYYWFNNFKRDRVNFNDGAYINGYVNRIFSRHLGPMASMYQNYLFGDFLVIGETLEGDFLTFNDFETGADWQAA
ncbi:MAG: zinc-dependent metalloprotease, partial [Myxococcota bacterium]